MGALPEPAGDILQAGAAGPQSCSREETPLQVDGELDIRGLDELHRLFAEVLGRGPDIVVDLAGVQACDTAALQLICSLRKTAVERGQRLHVAALSPAIENIAAALGLPIQELTGANEAGPAAKGTGRGL